MNSLSFSHIGFGRFFLLLLLLPAFSPHSASAQATPNPPGQISFQGFLVDANATPLGQPSPKNYDVIFRVYNKPTGTDPAIWGEVQTVTVDRGYFSVILGQGSSVIGTPFTPDLSTLFSGLNAADASDRYVGMTVKGLPGGDIEIAPRLRLLASPYSFLATTANNSVKLAGFDWSNLFPDTGRPDTGSVPGGKIAAGTVGPVQIANGAVGSAQIANGAVGSAQIASGAVGTTQLANGAVQGPQISLPLYLSGSAGGILFFLGGGISPLVTLTNTAVSSFTFPRFIAGSCLQVGGETAFSAFSQSGNYAYICDGSYAGDFRGQVNVTGFLTKGGGGFKIDHPLDPANKYLYHSFVESPDMKNMYDGVAALDANGEAWVELPAWFETVNKDFRYQLTAIGAPGPNLHIAQEVSHNRFKIAGGSSAMKVSWQITGVRQDAFANAHRMQVEVAKPAELRGTYMHPAEHGQPREKDEGWVMRHPASQSAATGASPARQK